MRVPMSWLREYTPVDASAQEVAEALVRAGFEVEKVDRVGADVSGVVVGEVLHVEELAGFAKPIRFVRLDTGSGERSVVCGATNFAEGDRVAVALPGGVLPGEFHITARETYGHTSDGMICSARELGVGDDHTGILVLDPGAPLGEDIVEHLGLRDDVLDIAVTPDRGYGFSVRGIAREVATAYGSAFSDPGLRRADSKVGAGYPVEIADTEGCVRYVARVVRGVDPAAKSPLWLQRRIALTGMRTISLVVDVTNYVMQGLGQPLHAFDLGVVRGPVLVRRAAAGERLRTLDGVDRALDPEDLLIADESGPIALAGAMGGASTEVTTATMDVLLEAACFDAVAVGRTSRRHNLVSEASKRFERGVDPDLADAAAALAASMLADLGGGSVDPACTDVDHRRERPVLVFPVGAAAARAGRDYAADVVRRRLEDVGCTVTGVDPLGVVPPSWRPDLTEAVDLTEEVIRLEGYDTIPSTLPAAPAGRGLTVTQRGRRWVGTALAGAGYTEVAPYPFMALGALDDFILDADDPRRAAPRIANPVSDAEPVLRTTLLPGLLNVLLRNVGRGNPDVALFEVGPVFSDTPGRRAAPRVSVDQRPTDEMLAELVASLPTESEQLAVVVTGARERRGWWGPARIATWADAVEAARTVATATTTPLVIRAGSQAPWHPGRCAELVVDDLVVGYAGELHPRLVDAWGLPPRTAALELALAPFWAHAATVVRARDLPTFPPAAVDVALVVDASTSAAEVEAALRAGAGELLEQVRLFDVYTGDQVPTGAKSLAFSLRFRAGSATLTDEVVNSLRDAAVHVAAERCGALLRG